METEMSTVPGIVYSVYADILTSGELTAITKIRKAIQNEKIWVVWAVRGHPKSSAT